MRRLKNCSPELVAALADSTPLAAVASVATQHSGVLLAVAVVVAGNMGFARTVDLVDCADPAAPVQVKTSLPTVVCVPAQPRASIAAMHPYLEVMMQKNLPMAASAVVAVLRLSADCSDPTSTRATPADQSNLSQKSPVTMVESLETQVVQVAWKVVVVLLAVKIAGVSSSTLARHLTESDLKPIYFAEMSERNPFLVVPALVSSTEEEPAHQ